jgi:hypothetical protein
VSWAVGLLFDMLLALANGASTESLTFLETRPMGKGNNSRKNDKKSMKPKQDKAKPAAKK